MKKIYLLIILLIVGCDQKDPININLLRPSKDYSIYYSKETNQPYSGPVFFTDENDIEKSLDIMLKKNRK